jgi:hypothetical protein
MPEVPKIVHHRLRATMPEQPHPEADVLTAFAEQALSASERDGVLQHLALCGDCRDVIALVLPAMDAVTHPVEEGEREVVVSAASGRASAELNSSERRKPRFAWTGLAWGNLRWAALAAGIAVAVLVVRPVLEHSGKTERPAVSVVSQPALETKPAGTSEIANGALAKNSEVAKATEAPKSMADSKESSNEKRQAEQAVLGGQPVNKFESEAGAVKVRSELSSRREIPSAGTDAQVAGNVAVGGAMRGANSARIGAMRRNSAPAAGTVLDLRASGGRQDAAGKDALNKSESDRSARSGPAPGTASEVVAVEAQGAPTSSVPSVAFVQSDENVIALNGMPALQNAPDITKAKPALDEVAGKPSQDKSTQKALPSPMAAGTSFAALAKQTTSWTIADGTLKRSSDGGQTWKPTARSEHALLCFTSYGQEMWAGGQEATLLHSLDNGVTWNTVAVSFEGHPLTSAVTHIDASSPTQIVLTTDNHETWSSADGGKTWEKK